MASSDVQRKLTAIMCADVVGYSRLMGENEKATTESVYGTEYSFQKQWRIKCKKTLPSFAKYSRPSTKGI